MRVCPRCQGRYDDESRFCPRDGAALPGPASDPRLGNVLLGQFELLEVCGRGAMGTVYRAWQSGMDREVAVKILRTDYVKDPAVVKRFHREARSVARLNHPSIVTVFMVGETDDHVPFMVMEYVDGEPLSSALARGEPLPVGRALRIARQIASALAEAHGSGLIHRAPKPPNTLLEQRRRAADVVKVVDFGIAKIVAGDGAPGVSALTHTGTIFGTPHYLSPEQAQGSPVDGRADLYSLGVMLFAMVTGRVPYDGSGMAVVVQHVNGTPPRPSTLTPGLPAAVEALVLRLMEKDPEARPQTAEDVSDAIDGLLLDLGEAAAPLARAESQPSGPVLLAAAAARAARAVSDATGPAALPAAHGVTIKASALTPPPGSAPPSVTVKGSALLAPPGHPLASAAPQPVVTVRAGAISPGHGPARFDVSPADVTVPPPSRPPPSVPEPRLSAETAYAMPPSDAQVAGSRPMSSAMAMPANGARPPSIVALPQPAPMSMPMPKSPSAVLSMDGGSEVWRPAPSPWRRVLLVLLALVFVGGAAVAGVYALGRSSARVTPQPPAPSAKTTGPNPGPVPSGLAADAAVVAAPKIGELPDATVARAPTGDLVMPSAPSAEERVITLGEGGWAVRVLLPSTVVAGTDVDMAVEAWDPAGKPIDSHELRLVVDEPNGLERAMIIPAVEQVGRFQLRRRFASPGRYKLTIYPAAGKTKVVVWFALQVEDPSQTGVMTQPEPAHKATTRKPAAAAKKATTGGDPYHLLEPVDRPGDKANDKPVAPPADKPKEEPPPPPRPGKNGPPQPKKDPPQPGSSGDVELE